MPDRLRARMWSAVPLLGLAAALAFLVSGCGSSPSAAEKWANSVCTEVGNWKTQVSQATSDISSKLQSPQVGTLSAVKGDVQTAVNATQQLATNLKALGKPDTPSGAQAKQDVDTLASELDSTVASAKQAVSSVPSGAGLSAATKALAPLAPQLQSLEQKTKSTMSSIQQTGSDMKKGFQQAKSCKQFR